jgi:hypothetical protein
LTRYDASPSHGENEKACSHTSCSEKYLADGQEPEETTRWEFIVLNYLMRNAPDVIVVEFPDCV